MDSEALKPCPFCGADDQLRIYNPFGLDDETEVVTCDQCNAEGPYYGGSDSTTAENAVTLWNGRALVADRFTPLIEKAEAALEARKNCEAQAKTIEALEADNAKMREALIKIDTLDGIGGPDGEVQCANIARAALQETER